MTVCQVFASSGAAVHPSVLLGDCPPRQDWSQLYRTWYAGVVEDIAAFRAGRPLRVLTPGASA